MTPPCPFCSRVPFIWQVVRVCFNCRVRLWKRRMGAK